MGERLWAKDVPLDEVIHRFTVDDDPVIDLEIVPWDTIASAAHARMLHRIGAIGEEELLQLLPALQAFYNESLDGAFTIPTELEDGHTAIEARLIESCGNAGRNIHIGRSRNDQVTTAFRLYMRAESLEISGQIVELIRAFQQLAERWPNQEMPGYTHLRRAMPSNVAQWCAAWVEGLLEELEAGRALWSRLDRCPLGGAAGFGASLPIDRPYTSDLLGFSQVHISPIDIQNSRGRHETAATQWLASLSGVLERFCWDTLLFSTEEFGYLKIPDAFTTGSSIMPHKRNPDVLELARGRCREIRGFAAWVSQESGGLPSSYHRDFQLLKKPVITAFRRTGQLLDILARVVAGIEFNAERLDAAMSPELYAAHEATRRVMPGMPFRDAYREVSQEILEGTFKPASKHMAPHLGNPASPGLDALQVELRDARHWLYTKRQSLEEVTQTIWNHVS